jgi:hypothetical protein
VVRPVALILLLGFAVGGCQRAAKQPVRPVATIAAMDAVETWRATATAAGQAAIDALDARWAEALAEAKRRGAARTLSSEGALLDPKAALPRAAPGPGPYKCRLLRIGVAGGRTRGIAAPRSGFCYIGVEDDQLSFSSEIGGNRIGGYLYETAGSGQFIFLGASAPARGPAPGYGEDAAKDVAGRFERVDEFRYRLVLPAPSATELQVFELIPAPAP